MLLVAVEVPAGPVLSINIVDNIPASLPHFEHYGLELRNARHVLILRGGMTKEADEVTSKAAEHNFFEDLNLLHLTGVERNHGSPEGL